MSITAPTDGNRLDSVQVRRTPLRTLWDSYRGSIYRRLGRSKTVGRAAVHLRRAATHQIRYRLLANTEANENGEWWFISIVGPRVRTAFDVGANVGGWAERVLRTCPQLQSLSCFEPSERATEEMMATIGHDPRVRIARVAVSDREGSMRFYEEPNASPTSSLLARTSPRGTESVVRVVTVDEEMVRLSLDHLDVLKIDVEGYDLHALRGAHRALSRQAITYVQFEYNRPWMYAGSTLQAAARLLDECDYELFLLNGRGLCSCDVARLGELFEYLNFVALPRSQINQLPTRIHPDPLWD